MLLIVDTLNQVSYILTMQENETPTKANNTMIQTPEYTADIEERIYQLQEVLEDTDLEAHDKDVKLWRAELLRLTAEYKRLN